MTEQEWLQASYLQPMLEYLRGKTSDRKIRLLLCAWSRLNWRWLPQQGCAAVEVAELFADGLASDADRSSADAELWWATREGHRTVRHWLARLTLESSGDLWEAAYVSKSSNPKVKSRQIALLFDIFGPLPFRSITIDSAWLTWHDGLLVSMARQMYDSRDFRDMPVLADALEESGCTNPDILDHCRSGGEHVRGCWVIDALLGKS